MNTAIFYFVGGDAFFSGFVAVAAGAIVIFASRGDRYRIGSAAILFGWLLVIVSATAMPVSQYAALAVLSVSAMMARPARSDAESSDTNTENSESTRPVSLPLRLCSVLCAVAFASMFLEFFSYRPSRIDVSPKLPMVVIGDSLSAGINDGVDIPWPTRLDEIALVNVSNNALAGATCRSAINQLDGLPKQCVVIVEIGGNDLLGGRSASEFRADLDALLAEIQSPGREVVMFELPLPPFFNGYGYAQRELADKHNVALIPRRLLASVLFTEDATLDSIHLSNDGHHELADRVASFLGLDNLE
jgi:acyl-CoA thioesterase-1